MGSKKENSFSYQEIPNRRFINQMYFDKCTKSIVYIKTFSSVTNWFALGVIIFRRLLTTRI